MNFKRVTAALAGFAIFSVAAIQVHGFVNDSSDFPYIEDSTQLVEMIDDIASNLEANDALDRIDNAISELDEILDNEPQNEGEILDLRDALVDLRVKALGETDSPEVAEPQLAQIVDVVDAAPLPIAGPAPLAAPAPMGGVVSGGGAVAGGGGVASGINWRRLLLIGGLVGGLASIDDDDDVEVVSVGS